LRKSANAIEFEKIRKRNRYFQPENFKFLIFDIAKTENTQNAKKRKLRIESQMQAIFWKMHKRK